MIYFTVIAYFLILIILSLIPNKKEFLFSGKLIFLFRIFFPSWKFFDESTDLYYIKFRVSINYSDEDFSNWELCPQKLKRNWYQFVFNPNGNVSLACDTILNHLYYEIYNNQDDNIYISNLEETTSYKITQNMLQYYIKQNNTHYNYYQFKISVLNNDLEEDLLISSIYKSEHNEHIT